MDQVYEFNRDNNAFFKAFKNFKRLTQRKNAKHYKPKGEREELEIEKTLEEVIKQYKARGYKIPDLSDEKNIFKLNPMLVEDHKMEKYYNAEKQNHNFSKDIVLLNNMRFSMIKQNKSKPSHSDKEGNNENEGGIGKRESVMAVMSNEEMTDIDMMEEVRKNYYGNLKMKKLLLEHETSKEAKGNNFQPKSRFFIGLDTPKKINFNPNETIITSLKSEVSAFKSRGERESEKRRDSQDKGNNKHHKVYSSDKVIINDDVDKSNKNSKKLSVIPQNKHTRKLSQYNVVSTNISKLDQSKMNHMGRYSLSLPKNNKDNQGNQEGIYNKNKDNQVILPPINSITNTNKMVKSMFKNNDNNKTTIIKDFEEEKSIRSNLKRNQSQLLIKRNLLQEENIKPFSKLSIMEKEIVEKEIFDKQLELQNEMIKKVIDARKAEEEKQKKLLDLQANREKFIVFMFEKYLKDKDYGSLVNNYTIYSKKHIHNPNLLIDEAFL